MITIAVTSTGAKRTIDAPITSGSVNAQYVKFEFDSSWDGLSISAVFKCNNIIKAVTLDSDHGCYIPWECLVADNVGWEVFGGARGLSGTDVVVPTILCKLGTLKPGADDADSTAEPTPSQYQQFVNEVQAAAEAAESAASSAAEDAATAKDAVDGIADKVKEEVDSQTAEAIEKIQEAADSAAESAANAQNIIASIASLVKSEVDSQTSSAITEIQSAAADAAASAAEAAAEASKEEMLEAIDDLISSYDLVFEVDKDDGGLNITASDYDDIY